MPKMEDRNLQASDQVCIVCQGLRWGQVAHLHRKGNFNFLAHTWQSVTGNHLQGIFAGWVLSKGKGISIVPLQGIKGWKEKHSLMLASIWVILIDLNKDDMSCECDLCSAKTSKALNSGAMSHMKPLQEKMLDAKHIKSDFFVHWIMSYLFSAKASMTPSFPA